MNILFISYFYEPYPAVGAKRVSYWAKHFKQLNQNAKINVITSSDNPVKQGIDNAYVVKEEAKPILSYFIKDKGIAWGAAIKKFLTQNQGERYTHVVISGGPFMQFSLAEYFKKKYSSKVILDYRDPFAINPRFKNSFIKVWVKRFYERRFNRFADKVITVNQYCLQLLEGFSNKPEKYFVIPNGYDETLIPETNNSSTISNKLTIIYAGSFYADRNPGNFLKVVAKRSDCQLIHLGKPSPFLNGAINVSSKGMKTYKEMLETIGQNNVGLIITSGEPFESTTKIYDYIAMNKPILIITSGEKKSGAIGEELKNYPAVWSFNTTKEIDRAIDEIKKINNKEIPDVSAFSRNKGLSKLYSILN